MDPHDDTRELDIQVSELLTGERRRIHYSTSGIASRRLVRMLEEQYGIHAVVEEAGAHYCRLVRGGRVLAAGAAESRAEAIARAVSHLSHNALAAGLRDLAKGGSRGAAAGPEKAVRSRKRRIEECSLCGRPTSVNEASQKAVCNVCGYRLVGERSRPRIGPRGA
jgi:DNA-directed RNA polymerase subunit RPC12/RpoP